MNESEQDHLMLNVLREKLDFTRGSMLLAIHGLYDLLVQQGLLSREIIHAHILKLMAKAEMKDGQSQDAVLLLNALLSLYVPLESRKKQRPALEMILGGLHPDGPKPHE